MDFYRIKERSTKNGVTEVYPDFKVTRSKDLMVRGKSFYAIWDEGVGLWSTDEYDVQRLVDNDLMAYKKKLGARHEGVVQVKLLSDFSSNRWLQFRNYIGHLSDSSTQLDEILTFSNTEVKKSDHVSRRLPYPLLPGDYSAWEEIIGTLYEPEERAKIEWAIGAIISGDSKNIQKFLVLYGAAGTGKSTILNIIQQLFEGYYTTFEAKALTSSSNAFSTEVFKSNPLVAIQHDGDLSKIEDNTKLNSIVSHEDMTMNEKYKPSYMSKINAFLLMGTNKAVKITDGKSGIIRRLIDVKPSGNKVAPRRYSVLMKQMDFELGAIACHCLDTYTAMGRDYYSGYVPVEMMLQTDVFFNYIEAHYDIFTEQGGVTLVQAHELYKKFCEESDIEFRMPRYKLREELKNYFGKFEERAIVDDVRVRSWYSEFKADNFKVKIDVEEPKFTLVMNEEKSLLDDLYSDQPAQYAKEDGTPRKYWTDATVIRNGKEHIPKPNEVVSTVLSQIDTSLEHYVRPPLNHIVIDFDLTGPDGEKSAERSLEVASTWPSTYAELSKSGNGVHLHYIYDGDASELSRLYDDNIEVKVFTGSSSLRRRVSKCNDIPVAHISSGLPIKEKKLMNAEAVKSEKSLRELIQRNLKKEVHAGTKPSVDFIHKILDDAYYSSLPYDVTDLRAKIMAFANNSSNQALYCLKRVQDMKFQSEGEGPNPTALVTPVKDNRLVFFDVEVFPNLLMINWKYEGSDTVVRMINPSPQAVEELLDMKLVGYNCRRYDNHILYGRFMGYDNAEIYRLSKKMITGTPGAMFGEAYGLSYVDIYDYSSKKQSLKKFQIELGIPHKELGLDWDSPQPEELWGEIGDYCDNDVLSTEATHHARKDDFVARQILADLSGLAVNETTQKHTAQIIFGGDREAHKKFVYTDLSEEFPGYKHEMGKSTYRGEVTGEGGYVYAEPGIYENVAELDIASMHPTTIEVLDAFGPYTKNFSALKKARIAIKHGDYELAAGMLDGKLKDHLGDPDDAEALSYALKIVINIVYGMTSARFDNPFKDRRNIDNIIAKRGALFMIDLKHAVQEKGFTVAHIKTDSIKIPNATKEIIEFVMEFGDNYGYTFEDEGGYEKMCLVNDAVYIAYTKKAKKPAHWTATGAQFAQPYVFKTLFSGEDITFRDKCQEKHVTSALYLDFNAEKDVAMVLENDELQFIGKAGLFCPIVPGGGGGLLLREKIMEEDGKQIRKYYAATGTKGHFWMESEMVEVLGKEDDIDLSYFQKLVDDAVATISKFGDFEQFAAIS